MKQRLNPYVVAPELTQPLIDLAKRVAQSGLEPSLTDWSKFGPPSSQDCASTS